MNSDTVEELRTSEIDRQKRNLEARISMKRRRISMMSEVENEQRRESDRERARPWGPTGGATDPRGLERGLHQR